MKKDKKIRDELLDELLAGYTKPEDLTGPDGLLKRLSGALVERALKAELTDHLGYGEHAVQGRGSGNSRNGCGAKTLQTEQGPITIEVPRDRNGTFEPQLVKKHQRRFDGFDDKILGMYARGMSVRDIQAQLSELYGTEVSPDLISSVTDEVYAEVQAWQARPLDSVWPIVYLDALVIKVRDQGVVGNRSAYLVMGVGIEGKKQILGLWLEANEGAKFWLKVITELKNRGVQDIFIACCDGLKGFPEAIEAGALHVHSCPTDARGIPSRGECIARRGRCIARDRERTARDTQSIAANGWSIPRNGQGVARNGQSIPRNAQSFFSRAYRRPCYTEGCPTNSRESSRPL